MSGEGAHENTQFNFKNRLFLKLKTGKWFHNRKIIGFLKLKKKKRIITHKYDRFLKSTEPGLQNREFLLTGIPSLAL